MLVMSLRLGLSTIVAYVVCRTFGREETRCADDCGCLAPSFILLFCPLAPSASGVGVALLLRFGRDNTRKYCWNEDILCLKCASCVTEFVQSWPWRLRPERCAAQDRRQVVINQTLHVLKF